MAKTTQKGLGNPLALATASTVLNSKEGQKTIGQTINAVKLLLVLAGGFFAVKYGLKKFKEQRAKNYANANAGHPDLIAASVIFKSFSRFEFPGFLSYLLPSVNIATDERALNNIAKKVTNAKSVAKAYRILYDRNLFQDVTNGLDTKEMQTFWNFINAPQKNLDTSTLYPKGSELYVAVKDGIVVNEAENSTGTWKGTNNLFKQLQVGDYIGEVHAVGVHTHDDGRKENYYIVKDCFSDYFNLNCNYGVVLQYQVTNEKS